MEQYRVTGMTCAACAARVERAVHALPGVTDCQVNLLKVAETVTPEEMAAAVPSHRKGTATLTLTAPLEEQVLKRVIKEAGYRLRWVEWG